MAHKMELLESNITGCHYKLVILYIYNMPGISFSHNDGLIINNASTITNKTKHFTNEEYTK